MFVFTKSVKIESDCELLRNAITAHGGFANWLSVKELVIRARSGGIALPFRFQASAFKSYEASISTTDPRVVIDPHPRRGRRGIFERDRVRIIDHHEKVIAERKNPCTYFGRASRKISWDDLDVLYFGGYALWNYLNLPFLLAGPGFVVKEIDPWKENGEVMRRLHVIFPEDVPTHCKEQIFYFDTGGLLVRHDYTAEVFGQWAKAAHYSRNHLNFDGLIIPTQRRVYPRRNSNHPLRLITLVSIDIDEVRVIKN